MARRIPDDFNLRLELAPIEGTKWTKEQYNKKMFAWQLALDRMKPNKPKFNITNKITVAEEE